MPNFRHHPDGRIYIDDVMILLSEFMIEEPEYSLPAKTIGRNYDGSRHIITNGKTKNPDPCPGRREMAIFQNLQLIKPTSRHGMRRSTPILILRSIFSWSRRSWLIGRGTLR